MTRAREPSRRRHTRSNRFEVSQTGLCRLQAGHRRRPRLALPKRGSKVAGDARGEPGDDLRCLIGGALRLLEVGSRPSQGVLPSRERSRSTGFPALEKGPGERNRAAARLSCGEACRSRRGSGSLRLLFQGHGRD
jgi:hypothetical protein